MAFCDSRAPTHHQSCVTPKDTGCEGGSLAQLQRPEGRMDCVLRLAAVSKEPGWGWAQPPNRPEHALLLGAAGREPVQLCSASRNGEARHKEASLRYPPHTLHLATRPPSIHLGPGRDLCRDLWGLGSLALPQPPCRVGRSHYQERQPDTLEEEAAGGPRRQTLLSTRGFCRSKCL